MVGLPRSINANRTHTLRRIGATRDRNDARLSNRETAHYTPGEWSRVVDAPCIHAAGNLAKKSEFCVTWHLDGATRAISPGGKGVVAPLLNKAW